MFEDHYKTLGIPPNAAATAVKAAYRALAAKYHPDKAGDNPFAESHFKEISAAYRVLSNADARRAYDEARWLRGINDRARHGQIISPDWILAEAQKLYRHIATIDTHAMNHAALTDYMLLLLSDAHLSVWHREATHAQSELLLDLLLQSTRRQRSRFFAPVAARLEDLAAGNPMLSEKIHAATAVKRRGEHYSRLLPLLIITIAALICLLIAILHR